MSVRSLTIQEMLDLPIGAQAVVLKSRFNYVNEGDTVTRGHPSAHSEGEQEGDEDRICSFTTIRNGHYDYEYFYDGEIGIVESQVKEQLERPAEELGMYRPELGTRKIGKIRVELVDHGFPRALREVAKVMTWAQTAKGYKDHDWQNLPNAEVALEAAASRHRTDHIEQRVVEGYTIERCVDHESGLLHKAHEAFGVLAQLELMLRGEFDRGVDLTH